MKYLIEYSMAPGNIAFSRAIPEKYFCNVSTMGYPRIKIRMVRVHGFSSVEGLFYIFRLY